MELKKNIWRSRGSQGIPMVRKSKQKALAERKVSVTQQQFDAEYGYREQEELTPVQKVKESIKSSCKECRSGKWWWDTLSVRLPFLEWLREYDIRTWLVSDIISGLTVGIMNIPQGMAYGLLTGLTPVYGLYTSLFPALFYSVLGTSRQMSVGTFAVISLMVSGALEKFSSKAGSAIGLPGNGTLDGLTTTLTPLISTTADPSVGPPEKMVIASVTLTMMVGVLMFVMGLLRLGFVAAYLSDQVVQGMTTGAACYVFTSQLKHVFGFKFKASSGVFGLFKTYYSFFANIGDSNYVVVIMSIVSLILLFLNKDHINPVFKKKLKFPLPMELILVVVFTGVSAAMALSANHGVPIIGKIPTGIPSPMFPDFSMIGDLFVDAMLLAVVIFSLAMSMAKIFANKHNYRVDANQEFFAFGIAHICSSFFQCHCFGGSLSRSLVQDEAGKTQIASIVASVIIFLVLIALASLFESLPMCILATIIWVALKGMFMQFQQLKPLWKSSKIDFCIWIASFLCVVCFGLKYGLIAGICFAVLTVIYRSQWPDSRIMGRIPGTELYRVLKVYEHAQEVPGVKIFRFDAALYFANVDLFKASLIQATGIDPLIEEKKLLKAKREEEARNRKRDGGGGGGGLLSKCRGKKAAQAGRDDEAEHRDDADGNKQTELDQEITPDDPGGPISAETLAQTVSDPFAPPKITHIVVDCSSFPYTDVMGVKTLRDVYTTYKKIGITVFLSTCKIAVRRMFERCNFFDTVPMENMFVSVHDAVLAALSPVDRRAMMAASSRMIMFGHGPDTDVQMLTEQELTYARPPQAPSAAQLIAAMKAQKEEDAALAAAAAERADNEASEEEAEEEDEEEEEEEEPKPRKKSIREELMHATN